MTSYSNACDVTVANSNHKNFLQFFDVHLCPPNLKKVPPTMVKPHAIAGCWRHKRRLKTSLRFVIALFANLGDLDKILQVGISD